MNELTLFAEALEQTDPQARAAFLERACQGDPALRERIDRLLAQHENAGAFLESSPAARLEPTIDDPATERPGAVIGPYKLLEQIGEGGMGTVWMAQQTEPVKRLVALKLIKAGMDSRQIVARFEAERQALALMDHAHIARVLDAGTYSAGRPYFVMDLVKGMPITKYCDEHHLTPRQRLELFIPVCQAVQHAHQKGIIHRDLKPSNVLVAHYDGKPVPKVIDFGVAKATGQSLTDKTLFTGFGALVGTPEYMSPEQAEVNNQDIDTRSDIYSLGVLLYELLAGSTPFTRKELEKAGMLEMLRVIREQEPSKPSTKLSTAEGLPTLAANRGTEPAKLTRLVRGELDWIVMKALEKDRSRRYETANGFAQDLQRYLADEQVLACPPSVGYRLRKLARRNRAIIMTLAVVLTTLTIGVTVSVTQAVRATRAEWLAEERLQTETKARNEAEEMRKRADDNARKARQTVDEYFTMVSESQLLNVPGLQPLRKRLLESAMKYYESLRDEQAGNSSVRAELAAMRVRIAQVHLQNNKIDDSIREWARTLDVIDELSQENPLPTGFPECLAGLLKSGRIVTYFSLWPTDPPEAVRVYQRAVTTWERFVRDYPEISGFQSDLACFYRDLGDQQNLVRDNSGALRSFETSTGILETLISEHPDDPDYGSLFADALEYQSGTLQVFERLGEAETASRRAVAIRNQLVSDFPDVPEYRANYAYSFVRLGTLLDAIGRRNEAVQAFEQAVNRWHALVLDSPTVPGFRKRLTDALRDLAGIHLKAGRVTHAEGLLRQANEIISQLAGEDPGERGDNLFEAFEVHEALASVLNSAGRLQEAQEQWQLAAEIAQKIAQLGVGFLGLDLQAFVWRISAGAAWNLGNRKEAERCYGEALHVYQELAIRRPGNFYYRYLLADTRRLFAGGLATEGRTAEAVAEYRRAIATHEEYLAEFDNQPVDVGEWTRSYTELAGLLKGNGRAEEAAKIYEKLLQALGRLASHYPAEPRIVNALATAHQEVGAFEQQRGRIDRAEQSYQRALDLWTKLTSGLPGKAEYRVHAATLLMTHLAPMLDASGRAADAEQAFQRGVVECNKLAGDFPAVPEYRHQRVELLLRRGNSLHFTRARTREAEQPYRDALAEAERLVAGFPDVLRYRMQLMDCRRFTALILVDTGRPQEAEAFGRQALDLATKLADESPAYPGVKAKLARVHWILGKAFAGSAHAEDAEKAFRKAVTLLETLAADSPSDRRELALVHRDLAVLLATDQNRLIEAETSYRLAIQLLAKVVADVPGEPYYRHELATCYNELAGVLARQGNRADGTPEWDKVAVEYTKAIELKPDAWEAWSGRALVHFRRQQWDAAIADFSKAIELAPQEHTNLWHRGHGYLNLELWDKAAADFTKIVDQMPEAAEGWYLRGVAVAQLNQPDKALADLRQAITKGFKNVDLMKNDSRLDPLRTREDFGKLLEELEQKEKSQSQ